jgi:hypothetical protein
MRSRKFLPARSVRLGLADFGRSVIIACLLVGWPGPAWAAITGLNTSGQNTYTDGFSFTRDASWQVVAVPNLSGDNSVPWSPPDGQSVPYDAYVYSTIAGSWIGAAWNGSGFANGGIAVPNGTAYWIGADSIYAAPTGNGGTQRDTAFRTTFVNTGSAGNYRLNFAATGDNFISIYANGTVASTGTNRYTVTGGDQIGTTAGNFTTMINYDSVVPLLSGTNELYVIIGDLGGAVGMVFGGFAEPTLLTPYWAPAAGAGGTQTWNTTDTFWAPNANGSGTKDNWDNAVTYNSNAYFGGTPGVVTTSGTLNVNTINLTTSGYEITGGSGSRLNFFGVSGSTPAIKLASGVSGTINANFSGGGGNFYDLNITGTGAGRGTLTYGGNSSMSGAFGMTYNVTNANLVLNGTFSAGNAGISLASNASLAGTGRTTGGVLGAGTINPGPSGTNSGVLTAGAVLPSGGLDFTFVYSGTAPTYGDASNSVNDVLRLTGGAPFASALTSANTKTLFLNLTKAELVPGTILEGGFFTDVASDFTSFLNNQTWNNAGFQVYVLDNGGGTDNFLNGVGYYNWRNPAMFGWDQSLFLSTTPRTANFGSGGVNGQVMLLTVAVPEPTTLALLGVAGFGVAAAAAKRNRRARPGPA